MKKYKLFIFIYHMYVEGVKHIGAHFRRLIINECQGDTIHDVLRRVQQCSNMEEMGQMLQRCCTNARGGQSTGSGHVIPMYNRRAIASLIEACLQHGVGVLSDKDMDRLQRMLQKSKAAVAPPPPQAAPPAAGPPLPPLPPN